MRDGLPPALEDLRDQLHRAAERDIEVEEQVTRRLRRWRWRQSLIVAAVAVVSVGGVAVAQRAFQHQGAPIRGDELPSSIVPGAGSGIVASTAAADPTGGPPWALRVFANAAGLDCVVIGRLLGGKLGMYDRSRIFHELPEHISGLCDTLSSGLLVAVRRDALPRPRTIVYGLSRDRAPVRVVIAGTARTVTPRGLGGFVVVRRGLFDMRGATASTTVDGRAVRLRIG